MKLITLILLVFATTLFAKTSDFSLVIQKPFKNALFAITEDYDREISAVGFSKSYTPKKKTQNKTYTNAFDYLANVSNVDASKIEIIKVSNNLKYNTTQEIRIPKISKALSLLKTPQDGYLLGGYGDNGSIIIIKIDAMGNIIFSKSFGTRNQNKLSKLVPMRDGGVLSIGSSSTSRFYNDKVFENGLGLNDIYLTRFSADGEELWSKKYGSEYDDEGIDAVEAEDGSLVVLATTKHSNYKDITLMRLTQNGDKIWLKQYESPNTIKAYKIIRLRDNNFLISLSQQDSMNKYQVRLIKFDLHHNIILDKEMDTTYSSALLDIQEYANGDIVGVGYVKDMQNSDSNGLVMQLDAELSLTCQEHFGGTNYDIFNALDILHNSQVAVAGETTSRHSQESNMWILKLNNDCTLAQISHSTKTIYKELQEVFHDELTHKKLTLKKDLTIELTSKELVFQTSQYKLNKEQKTFLDTFSKKLIIFLHKHKENIETLEVNGHASSEWGDADFTSRFLNNEKLSQKRSFSVLSYIFKKQDLKMQKFLSHIIKGSSYSSSKKILKGGVEDKKDSRRVSFKIILKTKEAR